MQTAVQDRADQSQVARDRRLQSQQRDRVGVDLQVEVVDLVIALDHLLCERVVAAHERADGMLDRRRGEFPQHHEVEFRALQGVGERLTAHPNLPVTYASVRWSEGFVNIVSVSSYSTTMPVRRPSSATSTVKKAVRSETRAACCMLWVTITIV